MVGSIRQTYQLSINDCIGVTFEGINCEIFKIKFSPFPKERISFSLAIKTEYRDSEHIFGFRFFSLPSTENK